MKQLDFDLVSLPEMQIQLSGTWVIVDIDEGEFPGAGDKAEFYIYGQRVSCKIGTINVLKEHHTAANIGFVVPPTLEMDDAEEIKPVKLVIGKHKGKPYSYLYIDIYEDGKQLVDKCIDCLVFTSLVALPEGDRA